MIEHTIQLDLFNDSKESKKAGRPPQIAKEIVFAVKDDLNRGLSNKSIIKKHDIKERTFFRIKKGDYDNLFKEAIKSSVNDFELELTK
ncbi:hypothetical protein QIW31_06075 [Francisellaceae bacterium CB299]|jgi:hypothetical protein